ncbi:MAG: Antitoxin Phd YefM, type toxin-antitoxin system [Candidatus Parcubacteria bacterium]|jgi:prevent-host-death family protein
MIKTIQATKLRSNFKDALSHVKGTKQPLIITERGVPTSVLMDIDEYEDYLMMQDVDLLADVKAARQEYKDGKIHSFKDVFGDIV